MLKHTDALSPVASEVETSLSESLDFKAKILACKDA